MAASGRRSRWSTKGVLRLPARTWVYAPSHSMRRGVEGQGEGEGEGT